MSEPHSIQFDNTALLLMEQKARPGINSAICELMKELPPIYKDQRNDAQKYNFRGIDDMTRVFNPLLAKYGITITPLLSSTTKHEPLPTNSGKKMIHIIITVDWILEHTDGSRRIARTIGEGMDMGDKSATKAMTSAYKYLLLEVFCIPADNKMDVEYFNPQDDLAGTTATDAKDDKRQADREEEYTRVRDEDKTEKREERKRETEERRERGEIPPKMEVRKSESNKDADAEGERYVLKGDDWFLRQVEDLKWTKIQQGKLLLGSLTKPQLVKLSQMGNDWITRESRELSRAAARYGLAQLEQADKELQGEDHSEQDVRE